jgi:hypothetical protein
MIFRAACCVKRTVCGVAERRTDLKQLKRTEDKNGHSLGSCANRPDVARPSRPCVPPAACRRKGTRARCPRHMADTNEDRIQALEDQLQLTQNTMRQLVKKLEEIHGLDIDGDGRVG